MTKKIGITIGDPAGIGPEIILKSIARLRKIKDCNFIIFSPCGFLEEYARKIKLNITLPVITKIEDMGKKVSVLETVKNPGVKPGTPSIETGDTSYRIIRTGIRYGLKNDIHGLVTAPVSKYAINLTGKKFTGHTEMLKKMAGVDDVLMFFVSRELKAGVVTTHIGIREVSQNITKEKILSKLILMSKGLKKYFSIKHPVIGVSALNPHAGEGGYISKEEIDIIKPAIESTRKKGIKVRGPFPSDTILTKRENFDALLFMYHDQAMISVKLLAWGKNVNVTLGLPFVRTSPDHGTAFDIAGKGIASPDSFLKAVYLACRMVKHSQ
jgi:4-hydroxythreonine-4-phosphate dehydrogenase